jgi:hypothetical protein
VACFFAPIGRYSLMHKSLRDPGCLQRIDPPPGLAHPAIDPPAADSFGLCQQRPHLPLACWPHNRLDVQSSGTTTTCLPTAKPCSPCGQPHTCPLSARFVCVSPAAQQQLAGLPPRTITVPNGVNTERFSPNPAARPHIRSALGIPDNAWVVGLVGDLDPLKHQDTLLTALPMVRQQFPQTWAVLAGEARSGEALSQRYAQQLRQLPQTQVLQIGRRTESARPAQCPGSCWSSHWNEKQVHGVLSEALGLRTACAEHTGRTCPRAAARRFPLSRRGFGCLGRSPERVAACQRTSRKCRTPAAPAGRARPVAGSFPERPPTCDSQTSCPPPTRKPPRWTPPFPPFSAPTCRGAPDRPRFWLALPCSTPAGSLDAIGADRPLDFYTYLLAAAAFAQGEDPYTTSSAAQEMLASQKGITHFARADRYPPHTALLLLPLLQLPHRAPRCCSGSPSMHWLWSPVPGLWPHSTPTATAARWRWG